MKATLPFALFFALICMLGCKNERSFFSNAGMIYRNLNAEAPKLEPASKGFYRFDICAHDTVYHNINALWFCDCTDLKSEGSVDSFAMAFVDEIRVVFFKRPKAGREINLSKPGKETKIGVYFWDYIKNDGSRRKNPLLVVRINSPRSENIENDFSDLFFEQRGTDLELVEMTYFDDDSSLTDMTRRKKKNGGGGPLVPEPKEGMKTIRPREVFALPGMIYHFVPDPIVLNMEGKPVDKIEYAPDSYQGFVRTTTLKNGDKRRELSGVKDSIATW